MFKVALRARSDRRARGRGDLREAERVIKASLENDGVSGDEIPELAVPMRSLTQRTFSPHEGFVLSRINGQWDVKSIMKISPIKELEVLMIFQGSSGRSDPLEEAGSKHRR